MGTGDCRLMPSELMVEDLEGAQMWLEGGPARSGGSLSDALGRSGGGFCELR